MSADRFMKVTLNGEELYLKGGFYEVSDYLGTTRRLLGLYLETPDGECYEDLSVSFGEFVGQYGCFFANVNGCLPDTNVETFLTENLIAFPGEGFKQSTFVRYPVYRLSPHVRDQLFTEQENEAYMRDFDFRDVADELAAKDPDWVKHALEQEKAAFDVFVSHLKGI